MRSIMKLADKANQYIDEKKPWQLAKEESTDLLAVGIAKTISDQLAVQQFVYVSLAPFFKVSVNFFRCGFHI